MTSKHKLYIKLNREEKMKLDDAWEVIKNIMRLLVENKVNGNASLQEGLDVYDSFWLIYYACIDINDDKLIPGDD